MKKKDTFLPKNVETVKSKRYMLKLASVCATLFLVLSPISANAVELTASGVPYGYGSGYKNVLQGKDAFQRLFKVGSTTIPVYSTSFKGSVPSDPSMRFQAIQRSKSNFDNISKGSDVAARSDSIGTPLNDANSEAVAVQLAIWHLLEGTDIKPVGQINLPILERTEQLIEKASAVNSPERVVAVDIKLAQERIDRGTRVSITLSASGTPLSGEYITVKAGTLSLRVLTNDAGIGLAKLPAFNSPTMLSASFNWSLPAGSILMPPVGASVITAKAATIVSKTSSKIPGSPVSEVISKPTAVATNSPTEKPTQSPKPRPSVTVTPTPSPTESMLTGDFEDPAADVIDVVVEGENSSNDIKRTTSWLPLAGVGILFLVALGIARQRLNK